MERHWKQNSANEEDVRVVRVKISLGGKQNTARARVTRKWEVTTRHKRIYEPQNKTKVMAHSGLVFVLQYSLEQEHIEDSVYDVKS